MTDLEKYELVNSCESCEELKEAIQKLSDDFGYIQGKNRKWEVDKQIKYIDIIVNLHSIYKAYSLLTRSYGIRQQMMYICHYTNLENDYTKANKQESESNQAIRITIKVQD